MLCEMSQRKTILYDLTYTWNLKNNKLKTEIRFALAEGKRDPTKACVQELMFMSRGDRNLGVAFQTHPGVRPRLEGKQRTLLSSRVGRVCLGAH